MPSPGYHAMLVQTTHDENARLDFVCSFKQQVSGCLAPGNRTVYEREVEPNFVRAHNRPPLNRHEVHRETYDLPGYKFVPRSVRKKALLVGFNAKSMASALKAIRNECQREKGLDPADYEGAVLKEVLQAYANKHELINRYIFSGIGKSLQNLDSQIAEYVFRRMLDRDVVVLGIHDSFIVQERHRALLESLMKEAFHSLNLRSVPEIR